MDIIKLFVNLFKGGDVWVKLALAMSMAGTFAKAYDNDEKGLDDTLGNVFEISGDALTAYKANDSRKVVKTLDVIILTLTAVRARFFGQLKASEQDAVNVIRDGLTPPIV